MLEFAASMKLLHTLRELAHANGFPFLLIGGHAVNVHGYTRITLDLDILIPRATLPSWKEALKNLDYSLASETTVFAQFEIPENKDVRLDLMLVNDSTFENLRAGAKTVRYLGAELVVVRVEHLIALKLHALRQKLAHRFSKDLLDVIELVRVNRIDLRGAEMQEILERYSTEELTHTILRHCDQ